MPYRLCILLLGILWASGPAEAHEVTFCGEKIPVSNDFVAQKLMNVIRSQIPNVNLPSLRQRALMYFPYVESCLRKRGLPPDLKYLPVVESGFANLSSRAGARGFWQLMPETARGLDLIVSGNLDERDDLTKSTAAACRLLDEYYRSILRQQRLASWILAAAAYNFGIGNILKAITINGHDYFTMKLNPETAVYVYKIIAVKELFENPELYMRSFGYNVFSTTATAASGSKRTEMPSASGPTELSPEFTSLEVKVGAAGATTEPPKAVPMIAAHITGRYRRFEDGGILSLVLDDDLTIGGDFTKKGNTIKGTGWIIDDRVYVDLGYGRQLLLFDTDGIKGIPQTALAKGGNPVILRPAAGNE